jgi:hypothetical protein
MTTYDKQAAAIRLSDSAQGCSLAPSWVVMVMHSIMLLMVVEHSTQCIMHCNDYMQ